MHKGGQQAKFAAGDHHWLPIALEGARRKVEAVVAKAEAAKLGVPFLGEVPLEMAIRATSDEGTPIVASQPNSPHSEHYRAIALTVLETLHRNGPKPGPKIVVD